MTKSFFISAFDAHELRKRQVEKEKEREKKIYFKSKLDLEERNHLSRKILHDFSFVDFNYSNI